MTRLICFDLNKNTILINNDLHKQGLYGNVNARKKLRQILNCQSFKWYLDHVYPQQFIPEDSVASGEVRICLNSSREVAFINWNAD